MLIDVGEPEFPIAAVTPDKSVITGKKTFKVGDHDFSKVFMIPDGTLIHTILILIEIEDNVECNKKSLGAWYTGQMFYTVKDMVTEGSSAKRGITETSLALESHFKGIIPQ